MALNESDFKLFLKEMNLDESEGKALLVIAQFGESTEEKISFIGDIPLPKTYDVIGKLLSKGLIVQMGTDPKTFETVEKKISKYTKSLPRNITNSSIGSQVTFTKRNANIDGVWSDLQGKAKKEFLAFSGDMSWIDKIGKDIEKLTKKKIKYKVILFKQKKDIPVIAPNVKKAIKAGAEIRFFESPNRLRGFIMDDSHVFMIEKIPQLGVISKPEKGEPWNEGIAKYFGTLISGGMLPKVFNDYFYFLWENSTPVEKAL